LTPLRNRIIHFVILRICGLKTAAMKVIAVRGKVCCVMLSGARFVSVGLHACSRK